MHKITRLIALVAVMLPAVASWAQEAADSLGLTATKCFTVAPTTVLNMLDNSTRLDMLDYFHAGVDRPSTNSMGGPCYIISEEPYKLVFMSATDIMYEIFVLDPMSTCPVIGVIETLPTPMPDSVVKLYDCRWKPLPQALSAPTLKDWLRPDAAKSRGLVEEEMPFIMASCTFDDANSQLVITNNMEQYFTPYDTPKALGMLKDSLVYSWTGKQFKLKK